MTRALGLVVLAALLGTLPFGPKPSCPAQLADRARAAYQQGGFEKALTISADLERCRDGSAREMAEALRWRALASAVVREKEESIAAFVLLETVSPGYVLDALLSPKFHELQALARTRGPTMFARVLEPFGVPGGGWAARIELFDPAKKSTAVMVEFETLDGKTVEVQAEQLEPHVWAAQAPLGVPIGAAGLYWGQVKSAGASIRTLAAGVPVNVTPKVDPKAPLFAPVMKAPRMVGSAASGMVGSDSLGKVTLP